MLNFTESLKSAFKRDNFRGYWVLRLYHDSGWIGISDLPRQIGNDVYYGIVQSWDNGVFKDVNLNAFRVRNGTMNLTLDNGINGIEGQRFSDLYDSKNFIGNKWELFQCDDNADFSTQNIIASGIISDEIARHNQLTCNLYLNDWWVKYDVEIPTNKVNKTAHPNAPEKNIDEPIPIMYGDCSGFNPEFTPVKVPAIITDGWEDDNTGVSVHPDSVPINSFENVYMYKNGQWFWLNEPTVENLPKITFSGNSWRTYYPLSAHDTPSTGGNLVDYEKGFDGDINTGMKWTVTGNDVRLRFRFSDTISKLGSDIRNIWLKMYLSSNVDLLGLPIIIETNKGNIRNVRIYPSWMSPLGVDGYLLNELFSSFELESWGLGLNEIVIKTDASGLELNIYAIGLELEFTPEKQYSKKQYEMVETDDRDAHPNLGYGGGGQRVVTTRLNYIGDIEAVYISGKGREYGSWINRGNGYSAGTVIENPVYIIEDLLRSVGAEINTEFFDKAGNAIHGEIRGEIGNVFNMPVSDIKFAFSQYSNTNLKELILKICKLSGLYFWWGADGKAKIRARRRTYTAVDYTIDYETDIAFPSALNESVSLPEARLTPVNQITNHLSMKYHYDYGANKSQKALTPEDNANLGSLVSQNKYGLKKGKVDFRFSHDKTTVNNYGEAQSDWFKERTRELTFKSLKPILNQFEPMDIVKFKNFPPNYKIYGETVNNSMPYAVTKPSKYTNSADLKVTRVAGVV